MQRTDARIGGSWLPACGALLARFFGTSERFWINLQGRYMTGSGSGSWRAHLGDGVRFGPVVLPGVRARNRGEGWVMAARKARGGYESRSR